MELRWPINLVGIETDIEGDVVTKDGEYLGRWHFDENDEPYFTPDGESDYLFFHPFVPMLCKKILEWHEAKEQQS
ncbi:hypothetical protein [Thalassorhabdomicrobium marinisediminis]|uniref:Uncharacterized protein n=1 Tax=Thalassorhabdomicrobium marinisediminis TaxID=2170577 RepID=A0A2T7FVC5_9RHOB|nr:hypothetical protein [Thalassorhabdomicrobium marinisediminis]PVA06121.1 hypothetical protein DC363_12480 [Thalassorhabdomicrobium marinisediminis]